jgi:hypothetical protein
MTPPAVHTSDEFPFILAAGQRRAFAANTADGMPALPGSGSTATYTFTLRNRGGH